jgi:hypothetical protein
MTINNVIPTVWCGKLLLNLNDKHVYAQGFNRDYEGDIASFGDSVKINSIGRPTVQPYTKNGSLTGPETLQDAPQTMIIDQAQALNFEIDDMDKRQQNPKLMSDAVREGAWSLADTADVYLSNVLASAIPAANVRTAATSVGTGPGDDDAYEILVDLDVILTLNNVPRDINSRWIVVPPWYEGEMRKDIRFVAFGTTANRENARGKPVLEAAGFTIYVSNNVPVSSSAYTLIAGYTGAATFAEQIPPGSFEAYRPEASFSDAMKVLHLYGAKVARPYALASCVVTQS